MGGINRGYKMLNGSGVNHSTFYLQRNGESAAATRMAGFYKRVVDLTAENTHMHDLPEENIA